MAVLYILQYRSFWHRSDVFFSVSINVIFFNQFFFIHFFCFQAKSQCTKKNWCEKSRAELTRVCVVYTSSLMREMCNSNVFILKVNRSPANQSPCNLLYYCCRCCCRCLFETWCAELGFWYMEKVIDEQKRIFHAWMIVIETKKMFCDKKKLKEKREKNWQTVIAFRLNLLVLLGLSLWFHLLVNLIWQ